MKKILLNLGDAYFINGRVGVGTYHSNIIWGLKEDYDIVVPDSYNVELPNNAHPLQLSKLQRKKISLLKWFLPINFFFKGYELIITDSFSFKKGQSNTTLYTIVHDCMTFTEPKNYTLTQKIYSHIASKTFKNADKIIAVSHTTKQTLHDIFHISFNKIEVITNITGFSVDSKRTKNFLYIGDMRKTKNLKNLILGYVQYQKKSKNEDKLIIAGRKKYEFDKLQTLVRDLGIENKVIFTGYVTESQKLELFTNVKALILLSENEGFGIPLIEACVNQIPVICSDIPVFHEILNDDFAIFVDNKNTNNIANAFERIGNKTISKSDSEKLRLRYSMEHFNQKIESIITKGEIIE